MNRTRRLVVATALVVGSALALGGVAYAADDSGAPSLPTPPQMNVGPHLDGHVVPGMNSNQAPFDQLGQVKF